MQQYAAAASAAVAVVAARCGVSRSHAALLIRARLIALRPIHTRTTPAAMVRSVDSGLSSAAGPGGGGAAIGAGRGDAIIKERRALQQDKVGQCGADGRTSSRAMLNQDCVV